MLYALGAGAARAKPTNPCLTLSDLVSRCLTLPDPLHSKRKSWPGRVRAAYKSHVATKI